MTREEHIDQIIERNRLRKTVFEFIPIGSSRILDFGCNEGELLHKLRRDKRCSELYGIEVKPAEGLQYLDKHWLLDLGEEGVELEEEYLEYFNYVILHDVIEHLYDPWYVLTKLHKYTSRTGKVIVAYPNAQFMFFVYAATIGYMPYGQPGGYFNEEHIRWFTLRSGIELMMLAGYDVISCVGAYHPDFIPEADELVTKLTVPPCAIQPDWAPLQIEFPHPIHKKLLASMKYLLLCTPTLEPIIDGPVGVGTLTEKRTVIEDDVNMAFDRLLPDFL